jgi:hypothetical protein
MFRYVALLRVVSLLYLFTFGHTRKYIYNDALYYFCNHVLLLYTFVNRVGSDRGYDWTTAAHTVIST